MRFARLCLLAVGASLSLLTLSGCGMSQEDKDFYLGGWVRPTDLDKPSPAVAHRAQALSDGSSMAQYGSSERRPSEAEVPVAAAPIPTLDFH